MTILETGGNEEAQEGGSIRTIGMNLGWNKCVLA
jgi:hypothetical protein